MPLSAQQSNVVDLFLKPEEIPHALVQYAADPEPLITIRRASARRRASAAMDDILQLLRAEYAIDFAHYKPSTVTRRIERRVAMTNAVRSRQLRQGSSPPIQRRAQRALPGSADRRHALLPRSGSVRDAREEGGAGHPRARPARRGDPRLVRRLRHRRRGLLARHPPARAARRRRAGRSTCASSPPTCTSRRSTSRRPALYDEDALSEVTPERRARYFVKDGDRYRVCKELRQIVVFAQHNLISDAPFTRVDLDHVPQPAHLLSAARAEEGAVAPALRAEDRRHAPARPVGDAGRDCRRVRDRRPALARLRQAARRAPARHPPAAGDAAADVGAGGRCRARRRDARLDGAAAHRALRSAARARHAAQPARRRALSARAHLRRRRVAPARQGRPRVVQRARPRRRQREDGAPRRAAARQQGAAHGAPGRHSGADQGRRLRGVPASPSSRSASRSADRTFSCSTRTRGRRR